MKNSGIGGQAVMEGVMMKNGNKYAVAVRKPDGDIVVDTQVFKNTGGDSWVNKTPIIRGAAAFVDSLRLGVGTLMYSAEFIEDEEEESSKKKKKTQKQKEKEDKLFMAGTVVLSIVLAVGIFMLLPYFLSQLLKKVIESTFLLTLCEGLIRIVLFLAYIIAISCMKDIKRVFMYHGAEHKSINCIENGCILSVENVRKQSRRHKRCGTSFLLIVMIISVFFFMFIRVDAAWLRILLRVLLIPVIAGVSYEFIKLAGRSESKIVDILSRPGLALQGLTTAEPDDDMIEVAIASVEAVFDWKHFLATYDDPEEVKCELDRELKEEDEEDLEEGDEREEKAKTEQVAQKEQKPEKEPAADKKQKPEKESTADKKQKPEKGHVAENKQKPVEKEEKKKDTTGESVKTKENKKVKEEKISDGDDKNTKKGQTGNADKQTKKEQTAGSRESEKIPTAGEERKPENAEAAGGTGTNKGYMRTGRFLSNDMTKPILVEDDEDEDDDILKALDRMFTSGKQDK